MSRRIRLLPLLLIPWLAACAPGEAPRTNLLLIAVDTLRADQLGSLGESRPLTPNLDRLAAQGVSFSDAYSHSPWTLPSFATLYTSRHPTRHGAGRSLGNFHFAGLPDGAITLGGRLGQAGYRTGAVVNLDFLTSAFGMDQGFQRLEFAGERANQGARDAETTTDTALEILTEWRREPFFLMVHYLDPHLTYDPPRPDRLRFAQPEDREGEDFLFGTRPEMIQLRSDRLELQPDLVRRLKGLYRGEVSSTDRALGRLLTELERLELTSRTLVVALSDHGEEFWDHQGFEHGHTLYHELLHVPLMLRLPDRLPAGRLIPHRVGLIDVAPTLLDLLGLDHEPAFDGRSLRPLLTAETLPDRSRARGVFSEGNFWGPSLYSWRTLGRGLIQHPGAESPEFYDLRTDPAELQDLASTRPESAAALLAELQSIRTGLEQGRAPTEGTGVALSEEQRERLGALGYLKE